MLLVIHGIFTLLLLWGAFFGGERARDESPDTIGPPVAREPAQSDTALVFLELFRTLYHLSNYGDKLLVNQQLDEGHCTQLLREIFKEALIKAGKRQANR